MSKFEFIKSAKNFDLDDSKKYDISIIIPAHNSQKFIFDSIKSGQSQLDVNAEIIVIDDGSTDETLSIALSQTGNFNVKVVSTKNIERSLARNLGLDLASAEVCVFLDADDLLHPIASLTALKYLQINSQATAVIFDSIFFYDNFNYQSYERDTTSFFAQNYDLVNGELIFQQRSLPISSIFFRKSNYRFPPGISICEDWIYWRKSLKDAMVVRAYQVGCYIRRHENNSTSNQIYLILGEIMALLIFKKLSTDSKSQEITNQASQRVGRLLWMTFIQGNSIYSVIQVTFGFLKAILSTIRNAFKK
jgi:glycosyltransferase involved in cell wall biosynthesis